MPISDGQDVLLVLVGLPSNIMNVVHGTDAFVHDSQDAQWLCYYNVG